MAYTREQLDQRNVWAATWVARRRERAVAYLGGRCARCGSTEQLEFDHVDRTTKSFLITSNLGRRWEVLVRELGKCQLLCHGCHRAKTVECGEQGGGHNKLDDVPHGTMSGYSYWKCRCEPCGQARYEYRVKCGDLPGTGKRRGPRKKSSPRGGTDTIPVYGTGGAGANPVGGTKGN